MGEKLKLAVSCAQCGSMFVVRPYRAYTARYCSASCRSQRVARLTAERRGDLQRNTGAGLSYRKVAGRHEHRRVAEAAIGRPLRKGEVVHHIDGNKRNNDPANLQVMSQREHMIVHGLGVPGKPLSHEPWKYRGKKNVELV